MKHLTSKHLIAITIASTAILIGAGAEAGEKSRQLEEVIVTAERKESAVQDTSISITAFTAEMLDDFGIRNQSDLQNLVPATTIQPYDSAVRGVGRNFRNLGGDPGVATYMNGVYSEDLYTATIQSFWDVERIEVLRGPQGTLYGRNAVGGAMNFIYKKPADEFEFEAKTILGSYNTQDAYFMVSGPLIEGALNARLTGSSREHDGWVKEQSGLGDDLDSGNETNITLSLEWNITEDVAVNIRQNKIDVDRVMGGANGGGLIVLTGENVYGDQLRSTERYSHGLRTIDRMETDPTSSAFVDPTQEIIPFTNPRTGALIEAQYVRPGVDLAGSPATNQSRTSTASASDCVFLDRDSIKGDDVCAYTNGQNVELFDQQGTQLEFAWDLSEAVTFKYIFGYNDLLYERVTDDDSTSGLDDRQFYVNHEAEYVSHELQLFWDAAENLSFTSGVFFYDSVIDQRYDFYSSTGASKYADPTIAMETILATAAPGVVAGDPPLTFLTAVSPVYAGLGVTYRTAQELAEAAGDPPEAFRIVVGPWGTGADPRDPLGGIPNGPTDTLGSDTTSINTTDRQAFAFYTQGVWDINDRFTLTFGARYAEDDVEGVEAYAQYAESSNVLVGAGLSLLQVNALRGAVDQNTLQLTGAVEPWLTGVPIVLGAHRKVERKDDAITWRLNLDYNWTDDVLLYGNITTGYRSGGFNLAFFSQTPQYEPEELIAYELGIKGQYLDNSLQLNASVYLYDYESIHTYTEEACPSVGTAQSNQSACVIGGTTDSTRSVQAAPGAEVRGFEAELVWLATDNLTLGGNFSVTSSEFSESFIVADGTDPYRTSNLYTGETERDLLRDVKGNQLPQVPESKLSAYANYELNLARSGQLNFRVNYSYISDVQFNVFDSDLDLAPSYDRIDLRTTWTSPSESWIVSGFVNNVTDDLGIRFIERHTARDGYRRTGQVTEPRVYGLEVSYTLQ